MKINMTSTETGTTEGYPRSETMSPIKRHTKCAFSSARATQSLWSAVTIEDTADLDGEDRLVLKSADSLHRTFNV